MLHCSSEECAPDDGTSNGDSDGLDQIAQHVDNCASHVEVGVVMRMIVMTVPSVGVSMPMSMSMPMAVVVGTPRMAS